jgi:hypothetical protein
MIMHNASDVRIMNYGNNSQEQACMWLVKSPMERAIYIKKNVSNFTLSLADDKSRM